ncbi:ubiquitin-conjugating enzyme E2 J2 [Macrosteles quadrilineatus]|uniref:ubiquitin-conjugating enzyme E2 J2 n=1 Tax=Macrosteles quadrilineatus TaxID=74068 RepID=UPI0023E15D73|nr:ubiquitin-conjugating enzyme E2 J2 [Macrosteles quadrilineatus]XP_054272205.1 ubiquitin-conjugating enzyme E2 J2 [Macrosteles quadrilineatus]
MPNNKHNSATSRLKQDYMRLKRDPVPYVVAEPLPNNILEWHYVVLGPENTPYEGGFYHGKLVFPREFPFKPPSIYMITPNGRFKTNTRLCLSISDFHPDTWNPAWSVSTILTGLLSFMTEKSPTLGSIEASDYERKNLAIQSLSHNLNNQQFCDLFPDLVETMREKLNKRLQAERNNMINDANENHCPGYDPTNPAHGNVGVNDQNQNPLQSVVANIFVFIGFAAFAYTVKYVLSSTSLE